MTKSKMTLFSSALNKFLTPDLAIRFLRVCALMSVQKTQSRVEDFKSFLVFVSEKETN